MAVEFCRNFELLDFPGLLLAGVGNRCAERPQKGRLAAARRYLLYAVDAAIAYQQRTIEIVYRRANVTRKKVKGIADLWACGGFFQLHGQMLFAGRKRC